ncbi:hypothetical protein [Lactiplantibacillus mudanjiangensis]|uniref:hypothetical protein n=1 Tax=Lactiplantibacillus mudanjiangensis TaxID=1296538 RepID=UPI0013EF0043|nr:hypothetical protein [Lactiplantibacillus mudanjiangensis]
MAVVDAALLLSTEAELTADVVVLVAAVVLAEVALDAVAWLVAELVAADDAALAA